MKEAPAEAANADAAKPTIEASVQSLLAGYRAALKFAWRFPALGRCKMGGKDLSRWHRTRWVSGFFVRLYLEIHVRGKLQEIIECLSMEFLALTDEDPRAQELRSIKVRLEGQLGEFKSWAWAKSLLGKVPGYSMALSILIATRDALLEGQRIDPSPGDLFRAGLALLGVWVLVAWPSMKLGFEPKRGILGGGDDKSHKWSHRTGEVAWLGFPRMKYQASEPPWAAFLARMKQWSMEPDPGQEIDRFPCTNVYALEDAVFESLGQTKRRELPLDMLLGFWPYSFLVIVVMLCVGMISAIGTIETWTAASLSAWMMENYLLSGVTALLIVLWIQMVLLQGPRNFRIRNG